MKKGILVLSVFMAGIIACSKKVTPSTTTTSNTPTDVVTSPVTTTPTVPDKPKSEEVVPAKEETKPLPIAGADDTDPTLIKGRAIYTGKCIKCHSANPVDRFTAARWDGILRSMIPKSKLSFEEASQVTAFVKAHCKQ